MRQVNIENQRFEKLVVLKETNRKKNKLIRYLCQCDCGNITEVLGSNLRNGTTRSCGCLQREIASRLDKKNLSNPNYKHGGTATRLYIIWKNMKKRCYDSNVPSYKYYGKKGIRIYYKWKNNFITFRDWALTHGYKDNLTIDRIDNNGNYKPSNCQFITKAENCRKAHTKI